MFLRDWNNGEMRRFIAFVFTLTFVCLVAISLLTSAFFDVIEISDTYMTVFGWVCAVVVAFYFSSRTIETVKGKIT